MKARDLERTILKAVALVRNDDWLPCSFGDLRNRMREFDADAGNASVTSIAEAAISLNQVGHLLLGKRDDGGRRSAFDVQKQFDEAYISTFFGRGSFEVKLTHQGRKHLEECDSVAADVKPQELVVSSQKSAEAQKNVGRRIGRAAVVLNVLIASPSDVAAERDVVTSAIYAWNAAHHPTVGIMLNPVRWETHSYPASGDRPQAIINKQIVESGDILIGIFGHTVGTPTGTAQSGTIEEIEEFRKAGKYVALYFSTADPTPNAGRDQVKALENYQRERQRDTLYGTFRTPNELRLHVMQHLPRIVADVSGGGEVLRSGADKPAYRRNGAPSPLSQSGDLTPKEIELLWNGAKDGCGELLYTRTFDGESIRTNGRQFLENVDARTGAEWIAAFRNLHERRLIEPLSLGSDFFRVTGEGYRAADDLHEFARWDARSVLLRARYMNAPSDEHTVSCKGIIAIPPRYFDDTVGADRSVQRSLKEPRSLFIEGIDGQPGFDWEPTEVEFLDGNSGQSQTFQVRGMEFVSPAGLKMTIIG